MVKFIGLLAALAAVMYPLYYVATFALAKTNVLPREWVNGPLSSRPHLRVIEVSANTVGANTVISVESYPLASNVHAQAA
jgi:hypothetical protein